MQKNLWICLILQKNRWLKYRFFAHFRQSFRDVTLNPGWWRMVITDTFMEPDFLAESEQFAGILYEV